jgi:hypothetical protein
MRRLRPNLGLLCHCGGGIISPELFVMGRSKSNRTKFENISEAVKKGTLQFDTSSVLAWQKYLLQDQVKLNEEYCYPAMNCPAQV